MANQMRSAVFQSKDGCGAVCGTLVAPNRIVYAQDDGAGGKVLVYAVLTGNVVETEYNEVVVVGTQTKKAMPGEDGEIAVRIMESIYATGPIKQYRGIDSAGDIYTVVIVPKEKFQDAKKKNSNSGKTYTEIKASGGEGKTVFIPVWGEFKTPDNAAPYVFMVKGSFEKSEQTYGRNEKWTTFRFANAQQLEN